MKFSFYIALRYLFSKKSHNAINLISMVSVVGIAIASMALVCTLSVYNGFNDLIGTLFSAFDPDLKITPVKGKTLDLTDEFLQALNATEGVAEVSPVIEGNGLVRYADRQVAAIVKGVSDNFEATTKIDSILLDGEFILEDEVVRYANFGQGLAYSLGIRAGFVYPMEIYAPKRGVAVNMVNPMASFSAESAYIGAVFATNQQVYDEQYMIVPIALARELFGYETEVTSIEIKVKEGVSVKEVQQRIERLSDNGSYAVKDRYMQQETSFRMMQIEKWITYLMLSFILMIAVFNVVGSLSMLIIEKKNDAATLRSMGADKKLISTIFLLEGWMISFLGAVLGIVIGLLLCFVQIRFGLIMLGTSGAFVVDAYPVRVEVLDVVCILATVMLFGWFSAWYPVRYAVKKQNI